MENTFKILKKARSFFTRVSLYIKIKFGWLGVPRVVPFLGYCNGATTIIMGTVVEDNGISKPVEGMSKWANAKIMFKRYFIDDYPGVKVKVTFLGKSETVVTNKFGVFNCEFHHSLSEVPDKSWEKVEFSIPEKIHEKQTSDVFFGEVMITRQKPQFGIISDIDDTILVSYATNKLMKFRLMFLNNALTRMPFEGVSAFYQSLQRGKVDGALNPIFYLSNSEWNLYDLLYEFIEFNRIPKGPLLLREMEIKLLRIWKMREYNKNHKLEKLRHLLTFYNNVNFILIGDSGQKDPEVYSAIIREFPGRILSVYIRDVGIKRKTMRIQTISESIKSNFHTEMILVKDTETAAKHAIKKGYILPREIVGIRIEKEKDQEKKTASIPI